MGPYSERNTGGRGTLNPMTGVFRRGGQNSRGESHVEMEAGIEVMWPRMASNQELGVWG